MSQYEKIRGATYKITLKIAKNKPHVTSERLKTMSCLGSQKRSVSTGYRQNASYFSNSIDSLGVDTRDNISGQLVR